MPDDLNNIGVIETNAEVKIYLLTLDKYISSLEIDQL